MDNQPEGSEVLTGDVVVEQPVASPKKSKKTWIIVLVVIVVLCCLCVVLGVGGGAAYLFSKGSSGSGGIMEFIFGPSSSFTDGQSQNSQPEVTKEPFFQLPDLGGGVKMGEEVKSQYCGFSFKKVPDYEYMEFLCIHQMKASGAGDEGPYIMLTGGKTTEPMTEDKLIAKLKEGADYTNLKEFTAKVDGKKGIGYDVEQTINGTAVKGRIVAVLINENQIFTIIAVAPVDQWDALSPYVDAEIKSIKFFTPESRPTEAP
jgi:hypothetical protein